MMTSYIIIHFALLPSSVFFPVNNVLYAAKVSILRTRMRHDESNR